MSNSSTGLKRLRFLKKPIMACSLSILAMLLTVSSCFAVSAKTMTVLIEGQAYTVLLYGDESTGEAVTKAKVMLPQGTLVEFGLTEVASAEDTRYIALDPNIDTGLYALEAIKLTGSKDGVLTSNAQIPEISLKQAADAALRAAEALREEIQYGKAVQGIAPIGALEPVRIAESAPAIVAIITPEPITPTQPIATDPTVPVVTDPAAPATTDPITATPTPPPVTAEPTPPPVTESKAPVTTEPKTGEADLKLGKAISVVATGYCNCSLCCGKYAGGATASGKSPKEMRTIAAPTSYAFGTKVYLPYFKDKPNNGVFSVEDRGGAIVGNKIDIFFSSHSKATSFGTRKLTMYVVQ